MDHAGAAHCPRQRRARVLIPDVTGFKDWNFTAGSDDILGRRLRDGFDIGAATAVNDPASMNEFDRVALERDERFNTRISGYVGWQQAARKLIPTPRQAAQFDLTQMVLESGAKTTAEAVDYLIWRTLRVPPAQAARDAFVAFLTKELGTDNIDRAKTYMEDALRMTVHLVMSTLMPDRIAAALPPVANGSAPHQPCDSRTLMSYAQRLCLVLRVSRVWSQQAAKAVTVRENCRTTIVESAE